MDWFILIADEHKF